MDEELLNSYIENWDTVADASVKVMGDLVKSNSALQRIRDLHTDEFGLGLCGHCSFRPYPCPTILALDN